MESDLSVRRDSESPVLMFDAMKIREREPERLLPIFKGWLRQVEDFLVDGDLITAHAWWEDVAILVRERGSEMLPFIKDGAGPYDLLSIIMNEYPVLWGYLFTDAGGHPSRYIHLLREEWARRES